MRYWLGGVAAAVLGFVVVATPAAADEQARAYSSEEVSLFADLLIEAAEIENARLDGAKVAPTDKEALAIHHDAERDLVRVIETSGLPLETFDAMVEQIQTDIRLSMQVTDELERRGAIPTEFEEDMLGDDAAGEAVVESGATLTRRALDGEAGF